MVSASSVLRLVVATAVTAMVSAIFSASTAQADNPSVGQIQVRLVQMRQDLNGLYAQSAAAAERLNAATYHVEQARADLDQQRASQSKAQASVDEYREAVADITVQRLQTNPTGRALVSVLDGQEPADLLQEASARSAVDEAMTAALDALDARQVVLDASTRAIAASVKDQERARADQASAQRTIDRSIARAEEMAATSEAERDTLLRQLAVAQDRPVAEVTRAQTAIDERIDESGPTGPPRADDAADTASPAPTRTTQAPTQKPSTPRPPKPEPADPPPASGSNVEKAISYARAQLGEKYVWGGAGPSSWDCSGLTMRAWQSAGVSMSHYAGSQYTQFTKVPVSKIKRGDLLFWSNGSAGSIYHVAMYLGGGQMIHAPRPGRSVEIVSLSYWIKPDLASRPG